MEIQVGEYVRTKEGYIAKFIKYGYNEGISGKSCLFDSAIRDISILVYDEDNFLWDEELKEYIVKHSFNIIDLIEAGDYVNGKRVIYVASIENEDDEEELCVFVEETQDCIEAQEIKSIVAKEMYESIKYEV